MMAKHGHTDEEALTRGFDPRLVRRLLSWGRPYLGLVSFSVFIIVCWTGLDLAVPFLTKTAVDDYIQRESVVVDWSRATEELRATVHGEIGGKHFRRLDGKRELVRVVRLKELDPRNYRVLAQSKAIEETRYYFFRPADRQGPDREILSTLTQDPPQGSLRVDEGVAVPLPALISLPDETKEALRRPDNHGILVIVVFIIAALLLNFFLDYARIYTMQYVGQSIMFDMRTSVFQHIQRMSLSFFDRHPVGRLVTRATNDVEVLNEMFANVLVNMLRDIFVIAGIVGVLFYLDWRLALVALASLPFVIGASFYFRILARQAFRLVRQKVGAINAFLQENISGIQVIKLFNRQMENQGSFAVLNEEYYGARLKELFVFSVFGPLINVLSAVSIGLIVWYGGLLTLENTLTLGKLIVFISYVQRFFHPIRDMSEKYNMLQAAMASSERIFQILDEPEEIRDPDVPVTLDDMKGKIEFRNVWFAYKKEDWVLRDISFTVEPGRSLALVGATGAGKTSIISLLGRFYEVNQGQILIDDVDIRQFKQSYLRSLLGVVMQDVFIFSGDFRDNIRLKNKNITDEEVCRAAECVMASGFIERYPDKYVEEVHERGSTLSAGERQLLAFARALAFDTRILVLDEATANIDTETEEKIQKAIAAMMKGRSTIVIAHRLSTVQNMDRIAVMHNGEITEMGTHDELMGQDGIYRNLIEIQALESKEP